MLDPDTGRDPALFPIRSDKWSTREGEISVVGAIQTTTKSGRAGGPFVAFDLTALKYPHSRRIYSPHAWQNLMHGAQMLRSAEDLLREAGIKPEWSGSRRQSPPPSTAPRRARRPRRSAKDAPEAPSQ